MLWLAWYSGKLRFPVADPGSVIGAVREVLSRELESVKARRILISGDSLTFTGGIFRMVTGMNILGPIDRGRIELTSSDEAITIRFRISFVHLAIVSTVLVVFMWLVVGSWGTGGLPMGACVFFWLWLVGGNEAIAIIRFRGFVKRCVAQAVKTKGEFTS